MTGALLPVGTIVQVNEGGRPVARPPYRARVEGYDIHRTKYRLASEYLPGKFGGTTWAFLSEVTADCPEAQKP